MNIETGQTITAKFGVLGVKEMTVLKVFKNGKIRVRVQPFSTAPAHATTIHRDDVVSA